jgi:hypothetical protein
LLLKPYLSSILLDSSSLTVTFSFAHHYFANDYDLYPCLFIYSSLGFDLISPIHFSQAISPISQKANCYPWYSICSRSSPAHQCCFNSFSSYRTPIDMKLVGLVPKFHKWISIKNSALPSTCYRRHARNIGAIRICKPCWPGYLHYFISRAMDLRLS